VGRTDDCEGLLEIADSLGGELDGIGCDMGPNDGIAVPMGFVLGLGWAKGPDGGAGSE